MQFNSVMFTCLKHLAIHRLPKQFYVTCTGFAFQQEMNQFVFDFENFEHEYVTIYSPSEGEHIAEFFCNDHCVKAIITRANPDLIQDFCDRPEYFRITRVEFFNN